MKLKEKKKKLKTENYKKYIEFDLKKRSKKENKLSALESKNRTQKKYF